MIIVSSVCAVLVWIRWWLYDLFTIKQRAVRGMACDHPLTAVGPGGIGMMVTPSVFRKVF